MMLDDFGVEQKLQQIKAGIYLLTRKKSLRGISLLDLGCFDGKYAIMLAKEGMHVTGIEARKENLDVAKEQAEKAEVNIEFIQEDIREVTFGYNDFAVVLASGILYHLQDGDYEPFMRSVCNWSKFGAIIDTHFSYKNRKVIDADFADLHFYGQNVPDGASNKSSVGNKASFWMTKTSLGNLFRYSGFSIVVELQHPFIVRTPDRATFICMKSFPFKKDPDYCPEVNSYKPLEYNR